MQPTLKQFFVNHQIILSLVLTGLSGCSHGKIPAWEGRIYPADSASQSVIHKVKDPKTGESVIDEQIFSKDAKFDKGFWMSYADLNTFYATYVLGCEKWRSGMKMMSPAEAYSRFSIFLEDMNDAAKSEASKK